MPTYTVHAPPPTEGEAASAPERFRFVRDGFHFWAFLLPPVWLIARRQWLALVLFLIGYTAIEAGLVFAGATSGMQWAAGLLIGVLMGMEAPSIRRWTLARRGWRTVGLVVGDDEEAAERNFYAEWCKRVPQAPSSAIEAGPVYAAPVRRGPPSGNDVIGLFPEPGAPR
ncbi:MAG: DUF2628 domain-containing protein [Pseudolabrys sp.]